jgi:integrase
MPPDRGDHDLHDGALWVARSIWNGQALKPKTQKSRAAVPVIRQLSERLELHRLRCGNPTSGPIFATSIGTRMSLNNILNRQMLPALNRCRQRGLANGIGHAKQAHKFDRDKRLPQGAGWHSARRGIGSNLYRLGVPPKIIQAILRHSNVSVTEAYYIKTTERDAVAAMEKFAAEIAAHEQSDSDRTLN